jgi:protoheme IX farnesyltransferase
MSVRTAKLQPEANEATAGDFFALLKPRVMSLVVFTGLVGLMLAPTHLHPVIGFAALLCIAVGAGAAGALNMWFDADIDARMERTQGRPIPQGRIEPGEALGFGATLAVGSVAAMGILVNWPAAIWLAATIGFYIFIYTMWLKRRTPQNIVIGGAAGAFPPIVGWVAATGGVDLLPLLLFAIIFLWTPPHFWALALARQGEYAKAQVPMLPVVAGEPATRRQIVLYSFILIPVTLAPYVLGYTGVLYGGAAAVLGVAFLAFALRLYFRPGERAAMQLFAFSILYLFLLFALLLAEKGLELV